LQMTEHLKALKKDLEMDYLKGKWMDLVMAY